MKSILSLILMSSIALTTVSKASEAIDYRIDLNCSARMELNGQIADGNGQITIDSKERTPPENAFFEGDIFLGGGITLDFNNYAVYRSTGSYPETHDYYEIGIQSMGMKSNDGLEASFDFFPYVKIKENKTTGECIAYKEGNYFSYSSIKNESLGISSSHDFSCELVRVSFHGKRCPVLNK